MKKLVFATPLPSLVDAYLGEIAKGYGIDWKAPNGDTEDGPDGDVSDDNLKVRSPYFNWITYLLTENLL